MADRATVDEMRDEAEQIIKRATNQGAEPADITMAAIAVFLESSAQSLIEIREELTALREAVETDG